MQGDLPNPANPSRPPTPRSIVQIYHCINPVIRIIRIACLPSPHLNLPTVDRILEILPTLRATSADLRPKSNLRITRLADTEAVGVLQRHGDDESEECRRSSRNTGRRFGMGGLSRPTTPKTTIVRRPPLSLQGRLCFLALRSERSRREENP